MSLVILQQDCSFFPQFSYLQELGISFQRRQVPLFSPLKSTTPFIQSSNIVQYQKLPRNNGFQNGLASSSPARTIIQNQEYSYPLVHAPTYTTNTSRIANQTLKKQNTHNQIFDNFHTTLTSSAPLPQQFQIYSALPDANSITHFENTTKNIYSLQNSPEPSAQSPYLHFSSSDSNYEEKFPYQYAKQLNSSVKQSLANSISPPSSQYFQQGDLKSSENINLSEYISYDTLKILKKWNSNLVEPKNDDYLPKRSRREIKNDLIKNSIKLSSSKQPASILKSKSVNKKNIPVFQEVEKEIFAAPVIAPAKNQQKVQNEIQYYKPYFEKQEENDFIIEKEYEQEFQIPEPIMKQITQVDENNQYKEEVISNMYKQDEIISKKNKDEGKQNKFSTPVQEKKTFEIQEENEQAHIVQNLTPSLKKEFSLKNLLNLKDQKSSGSKNKSQKTDQGKSIADLNKPPLAKKDNQIIMCVLILLISLLFFVLIK